MEMRTENADGKEKRDPLGRWEGHGLFVGNFASQAHRTRSVRQIHTRENGNLRVD